MFSTCVDLSTDFKRFLSETGERSDWDVFQRTYWRPNADLLDVWFGPPSDFWQQRVKALDLSHYRLLVAKLDVATYQERIRSIWNRCEELLDITIDADLCLLIGLGPTGKVDRVRDRQVVFLPVDLPLDTHYEIGIAHEVFHIGSQVLQKGRTDITISPSNRTLLDLVVNEGMATAFSLLVCPGNTIADALFWLRGKDVEWMETHEQQLLDEMSQVWHDPVTSEVLERYVWDSPGRKADIPPQTAYFIGCKICQQALEYTHIKHLASLTATEVVALIDGST